MSAHRSRTRRRTRLWQAASLVLAVAAGAVLVLPLPDAAGSAANEPGPSGGIRPPGPSLEADKFVFDDTTRLAGAFSKTNPAEQITPPQPPGPDEIVQEPEKPIHIVDPTPPVAGRTDWVFLGSAVTPRARRALVRIDQEQKFVREGAQVGSVQLVEVHDDHILIDQQGVRRRVDKAPMVAEASLSAPRTPPGAAAARTTPPASGAAGSTPPPTPPTKISDLRAQGAGPTATARILARLSSMPSDRLLALSRTITDPSLPFDRRLEAVYELGLEPDMTIDERREVVRAIGLNADDPDLIRMLESEMNAAKRDMR